MTATKRILQQLAVLLGLYSLVRILFYILNRQLFLYSSTQEIILACLNGIRYDLAAIALINTLFFVLYLIPMRRFERSKRIVLGLSFTLVNGFALSCNVIDLEYFRFTGKRITMDSFLLARDIGDQTAQIAIYYWYFSLLQIAMFALIAWTCFHVSGSVSKMKRNTRVEWKTLICAILLGGLAIRGGFQAKPLIPASAFSQNPELGSLVLNSTFTILKSSDKAAVVALHEMPWDEVKKTILSDGMGPLDSPLSEQWIKPKNVVVVILESFGSEYVFPPSGKPAYAPFLKSLALSGSFFDNAYANGRRSIDALPAIFAGIPQWMEPPFITSPYQTNRIVGVPQIFQKAGYETVFYHGGNNGTMFFDVMTKRLGFDEYVGADQYPDRKDYDGKWGIFDEPFLKYMAKDLSQRTKPFLATVFTLSSHHPYTIPTEHTNEFPKGSLEIHESVGYADLALKRFYKTAQKEPWFKDTLFIFTADHTSKQEYLENDNIPGRFHVPLILIMNDQPLPFAAETYHMPVQHADIEATLLDLARLAPPESSHFGESLCRPITRPGIIVFESDGYHLVGNHSGTSWWKDGRTQSFPLLGQAAQGLADPYQIEKNVRFLKANAHYYNNGMVENKLIW
ncbi:MAG: sulfatase-like hydrolase/transferase [Oligoflexus sp.]|nr:sulfatase-like hydrolase/transferase [Oligoflexus sp.]